jgi:hypothetical protein
MCGDPVEIIAVKCTGDQSITAIGNSLPGHLDKEEFIPACFSFSKPLFHKFNGNADLILAEKSGGTDYFFNTGWIFWPGD